MVNVLPPSNDSQSSISQNDGQLIGFGIDRLHSTLTLCPGYTPCPPAGEINWGEYGGGGGGNPNSREGAKANASKNNVTTKPRVFIFDSSVLVEEFQIRSCQVFFKFSSATQRATRAALRSEERRV